MRASLRKGIDARAGLVGNGGDEITFLPCGS